MQRLLLLGLGGILLWRASPAAELAHPVEGLDVVKRDLVRIDPKREGRATVVAFLSARCPCSASHEPVLAKLAAEFPGMRFVGVHSNSDEDDAFTRAHFTAAGLPFPVVQDNHSQLARELGAFKTPHVFVLSPKGEVLFSGGVDDSHFAERADKHYLKEALVAVAEGREPTEKEVRTLGCIIKRE